LLGVLLLAPLDTLDGASATAMKNVRRLVIVLVAAGIIVAVVQALRPESAEVDEGSTHAEAVGAHQPRPRRPLVPGISPDYPLSGEQDPRSMIPQTFKDGLKSCKLIKTFNKQNGG